MYHKKFDKEILLKIKELYRYDNWHAVLAILYDYLIIIFSIFLSEQSYWFLPLTILLIGSRQRALATILHEASHSALTKNKKFGQILGTYFSGYLIFQSWNSYCVSHVKNHHPKLGTDSDPDYKY
ncbi:TPA: fatty acid desaturase, partial [Neisseria meningitidis]